MFGQVIFYIFASIFVLALGTFAVTLHKLRKDPREKLNRKLFLIALISAGVGVVSFTSMMSGAYGFIKAIPSVLEVLSGVLGSLLFSFTLFVFVGSFVIHYYRKNLDPKFDKILYYLIIAGIPLLVISFFILTNGYADYLSYPLINGFSFDKGFTAPPIKPNIAFYAICILSGAILVYFLCDHKMYKQYGKHGILESTFFVAFPAGILGARLFYVIGEWKEEFANAEWYRPFMINDGGLTILGGAITGIAVGVLWFMWRNRKYNIWVAVDIILPTILIAQAVGRWGNFFNCEVHGQAVDPSYFFWLPKIILNNAAFSSSEPTLTNGLIYLPLFAIEALLNLLGYLLIGEIIPRFLKKERELGDCAAGYLVWYGAVRSALEPLRVESYNMGADGYWSWIWSIAFVFIGLLFVSGNHFVRNILNTKKGINVAPNKVVNYLRLGIVSVISLGLIIPGIALIATNPFSLTLEWSLSNLGIYLLIIGAGVITLLIPSIQMLVLGSKKHA